MALTLRCYRRVPAIVGMVLGGSLAACASATAKTTCPTSFASGVEPTVVNPKLARLARPLCFQAFAVLHSGVSRTPLYSAEHLTRVSVEAAQELYTRDNQFHADEGLPVVERAELEDYVRSGFDRGHMVPSGDMGDPAADHESFSLANIVPQVGTLNRNSWAALEDYVRKLTLTLGETYVVTGPLYEGTDLKRVGGRVLVPTSVWKALYVPSQGAGAWIATNEAKPKWTVVSIATLAGRTGIDPFPTLDAATKAKVPKFPNFSSPSLRLRRRSR